MTGRESAAWRALKVFVLAVARYNEIIDRPDYDTGSREYIDAANAMDAAEAALLTAADFLLEDGSETATTTQG